MENQLAGTVLVVEDVPSERALMQQYLQESGCLVISATSARDALNRVSQQPPDVIVTDVIMPGMSGFELCRSLKQHPETAHVPIVICSAKNQGIDRLWGIKQGADAYLSKPYTQNQLIKAVSSVMRGN